MQPPGADVFSTFIHLPRGFSNLGDTVCTEAYPEFFCSKQRLVLFSQGGVWFLQYAFKVLRGQRVQFYPNRQPALKLGYQV